jgi:hypothetical protein
LGEIRDKKDPDVAVRLDICKRKQAGAASDASLSSAHLCKALLGCLVAFSCSVLDKKADFMVVLVPKRVRQGPKNS